MLSLPFRVLFALGALIANLAQAQQPPQSAQTKVRPAAPLFTAIPAERSGVTMRHPLVANHPRAYLYLSGFACGSISIGGVNDVGVGLVFTSGPETNKLYLQTDKPLFFATRQRQD
jgi:hypothetical protein